MNWTEWMNRSNDGSLFGEVFFLPCIPQKKTIFLEWNKMERPVCRFEARMDRKETFFSSASRLLILDRENSSIPQPITMEPLLWDTSSTQGTKFCPGKTPLFRGKGHFVWVPKPGFNLYSGDTLAINKWQTTEIVDSFKCSLEVTMVASKQELTHLNRCTALVGIQHTTSLR